MNSPDEFVGPVNLGNPHEFTVLQLANSVIQKTKSQSAVEFKPLPTDDPVRRQPDISLARAQLGWNPSVPLSEGLSLTIEYFTSLLADR
jgi:UDP-glucuronate decarboxylase